MKAEPGRGQTRKPGDGELSAMTPVRLRRLSRWLVEDLREDLAGLYVGSRATPPGDPYRRPSRQNFVDRLIVDMRRPELAMVIAETDRLMGCAFGLPVQCDGSWWLGFEGTLPRSVGQLTVSGNAFAFTGILIRPHPQDRGLARQVQERLLTGHQAMLGATLVDRADRPTLAAFRSWGWLDIGELRRPLGAATLRAPVFPLGERTTVRLEGLVTMPGDGGPGGA